MGLLFKYSTCEDSMDTTRQTRQESVREFSEDEEELIIRMFKLVGERWHLIAGRAAQQIEEYWTSKHLSSSSSSSSSSTSE